MQPEYQAFHHCRRRRHNLLEINPRAVMWMSIAHEWTIHVPGDRLNTATRELYDSVWMFEMKSYLMNKKQYFVTDNSVLTQKLLQVGSIGCKSSTVQTMAWCRTGDNPLPDDTSSMHICATTTQRVNYSSLNLGHIQGPNLVITAPADALIPNRTMP